MITKRVFQNSWLTVEIPKTLTGWCSVVLMVTGAVDLMSGNHGAAIAVIQCSLLLEIVDYLRNWLD